MPNKLQAFGESLGRLPYQYLQLEEFREKRQDRKLRTDLASQRLQAQLSLQAERERRAQSKEARDAEIWKRKASLPTKVGNMYVTVDESGVPHMASEAQTQMAAIVQQHDSGMMDDGVFSAQMEVLDAWERTGLNPQQQQMKQQADVREERMTRHEKFQEGMSQAHLGIAQENLGLSKQRLGLARERTQNAATRAQKAAAGDKPGALGRFASDIQKQVTEGILDEEEGKQLIQSFANKSAQFAPSRTGMSTESTTVSEGDPWAPEFSKTILKGADAARYQKSQQTAGKELNALKSPGYLYDSSPPLEAVDAYIASKEDPIERLAALRQAEKVYPKYKGKLQTERLPLAPEQSPAERTAIRPFPYRPPKKTSKDPVPESLSQPTQEPPRKPVTRDVVQQAVDEVGSNNPKQVNDWLFTHGYEELK